jgi:hypothetical protein
VAAIYEEAGNPPIRGRVPGLPEVAVLSAGVDSRQFRSAPELAPADGLALMVNEDAMRRMPFDQTLVVPSVLCVTVAVRQIPIRFRAMIEHAPASILDARVPGEERIKVLPSSLGELASRVR